MFDFRKEVIINSDKLSAEDGGLTRVSADGSTLRVLRCADYIKGQIKNPVYVAPVAGTPATVTLAAKGGSAVLVEIVLGLDKHRMHGEFANPWSNYEKVIRFECADGTLANQIAALKDVIEANPIVTVTDGGVVTCKDVHATVKSAKMYTITEDAETKEQIITEVTTGGPTINKGVRPVNTGELLTENLRFPSYPNLRYAAEHEEERPTEGALYHLFVFDYESSRVGLHGQGAVGQQITSVTTHAFYVKDGLDAVEVFDTALGLNKVPAKE